MISDSQIDFTTEAKCLQVIEYFNNVGTKFNVFLHLFFFFKAEMEAFSGRNYVSKYAYVFFFSFFELD